MKNSIKISLYTITLITLFTAQSCKIDKDSTSTQTTAATNFKDLKVSSTFGWKGTTQVAINLKGYPTPVQVTNTLQITSIDGETVYFKRLHTMSEDLNETITLPKTVTLVKIKYGSISKQVNVTGNAISFDLLSELPPEANE